MSHDGKLGVMGSSKSLVSGPYRSSRTIDETAEGAERKGQPLRRDEAGMSSFRLWLTALSVTKEVYLCGSGRLGCTYYNLVFAQAVPGLRKPRSRKNHGARVIVTTVKVVSFH